MAPTDRNESPPTEYSTSADEVLQALPDLVFELTPDGRYVAIHSGEPEQLYAGPEEFLDEHFSDVLPESVAEQFDQAVSELQQTGRKTSIRYLLPVSNEMQYFEARLLPLESGNILAQIQNITESWQVHRELEQSESRYRTLVNNIPGLVYRCHTDEMWTPIFVSPAIEEMLGYRADEFHEDGRTLGELTHPEDRRRVYHQACQAIDRGEPFRINYRMIDSDGEIHHMSEQGRAVYGDDGEPKFLDGVVFDVTEMHQMRQRMMINSKMAAVGNLAAGVAHEINNPLTIALANLEYVAEELEAVTDITDSDSPVGEALQDMNLAITKTQEGIDRVRGIVDNLRTFTDAAESRANRVDLQNLVDWAIRRKCERIDCNDRIELNLRPVPAIWASEVGIVQVIWALVDNALEALERAEDDGKVQVTLDDDDDHAVLTVSDDGPGMPQKVAERAFEPFYTTKQVGQGAGLGLFVCQGLIDGMEGSIDVDTAEGEGTTIRVTLPAAGESGAE